MFDASLDVFICRRNCKAPFRSFARYALSMVLSCSVGPKLHDRFADFVVHLLVCCFEYRHAWREENRLNLFKIRERKERQRLSNKRLLLVKGWELWQT